ncbi:MAG: nitroreductase family protein, partial [Lentisphaeria bacterium]|nr:nitroreductase family protein [Lentisphaeria bacterium]
MNFDELLKRRTVRRFLQKEIPVEKIKKILDAARKASCA